MVLHFQELDCLSVSFLVGNWCSGEIDLAAAVFLTGGVTSFSQLCKSGQHFPENLNLLLPPLPIPGPFFNIGVVEVEGGVGGTVSSSGGKNLCGAF